MWKFGVQRLGFASAMAWCLIGSLLCLNLAGCDGSGGNRTRVARAPGSPIDPDELVGRWKLAYVQVPVELDFCLLDITHQDKKFAVKVVADEHHPMNIKLKSADIKNDGQARLEFETGGLTWSYEGRLDGETVWGTMMIPKYQLTPAKLERTELKELAHTEPPQIASLPDLMGAENAGDKFVAMNEFVKKKESYRSPLLIEGYASLAKHFKTEKLTLPDIKEIIAEYRKAIDVWGSRMAPRVDLEIGKALAMQKLEPALAKELLATAEKQISEDYPIEWKTQLADSWVKLGEYERGLKLLAPLQELDPTNPFNQLVYASAKEQAKQTDEALKVYAGLATLPQFERLLSSRGADPSLILPSEAVARLWKAKHEGKTTGLDAFLKEAYENQMQLYVPKRTITERKPDSQVLLLELFTGATCDPCVPIDIAADALHRAFSSEELIVIKYHEHSPLADPLANDATAARFQFYQGEGTPMLMLNGQPVPQVGGMIMMAGSQTRRLRMGLEHELKQTTPVGIKLAATRDGDEIKIKASVSGITTTDNDPRLYLVLIENDITFFASNGIKHHSCVARDFPGGVEGMKLKPGPEVDHDVTVSLTKVRADLAGHLKQFEDQAGREFPSKPMALTKLQVVAIVQNQITKRYMQAKLVDLPDGPASAEPVKEPVKEPVREPVIETSISNQ